MEDIKKQKGIGCTISACLSVGCLFLIIIGIGLAGIVTFNPKSFKNTAVDFLNNDIVPPTLQINRNADQAKLDIAEQVTTIGENTVIVSNENLTVLASSNLKNLKNLVVITGDNSLSMYWNLGKESEDPVYLYATFDYVSGDTLHMTRFGTGRIGFPKPYWKLFSSLTSSDLNVDSKGNTSDLIYQLLASDKETYEIKSIKLQQDKIEFKIDVRVNIFNND